MKKSILAVVFMGIIMSISSVLCIFAQDEVKVFEITDNVNVRATPGLDGEIIASLEPGDNVEVYGISDGWAEIVCNGITAFVSTDYMKEIGEILSESGAETEKSKMSEIKDLSVGKSIRFGTYEQDGNLENGFEPLSWRVLKVDGQKAMLLTQRAIEARPYHHEMVDVTYENSDMRKWLNNDFYNAAFTEEEKNCILTTEVDNANESGWGISGGNNTYDKVFLLSWGEAFSLLDDSSMKAYLTKHAIDQSAYNDDGIGRWFLRSPGNGLSNITVAQHYYASHEAAGLTYSGGTVRAAIWIDTSLLN